MKITSCKHFEEIENTLKNNGKNLEIEETVIDSEMNFKQVSPLIYFKTGKTGIKKKEYVHLVARFCPVCGKEIEVSNN